MTETMRAERFYAETKSVVVEDVPIPEPGPGEVLVRWRTAASATLTSALSMGPSRPRSRW